MNLACAVGTVTQTEQDPECSASCLSTETTKPSSGKWEDFVFDSERFNTFHRQAPFYESVVRSCRTKSADREFLRILASRRFIRNCQSFRRTLQIFFAKFHDDHTNVPLLRLLKSGLGDRYFA